MFNFFIPLFIKIFVPYKYREGSGSITKCIQLSLEFSNVIQKCHFAPQHLVPAPPSGTNKVCEVVVCSWTYFLVPVLHAGYLRYYTILSQFVQFVEDCVWLLESSPASCLAPRKHCEEKRKKFITRRINNKSPSHFSFDTVDAGTVSNFEKLAKAYFSPGGKTSLFERNTILSHPLGTLKVFWWLTYSFF